MNDWETTSGVVRLNLLLFTVGGVCFAVDAEQVDGMSGYQTGESGNLLWFHELLGFGYRDVTYREPAVLAIKTVESGSCRVIIDNMEDIAEYSVSDIVPLPALLEPFAVRNGIWGVLKRDSVLTLLVDFHRIANLPDILLRITKECIP